MHGNRQGPGGAVEVAGRAEAAGGDEVSEEGEMGDNMKKEYLNNHQNKTQNEDST